MSGFESLQGNGKNIEPAYRQAGKEQGMMNQ